MVTSRQQFIGQLQEPGQRPKNVELMVNERPRLTSAEQGSGLQWADGRYDTVDLRRYGFAESGSATQNEAALIDMAGALAESTAERIEVKVPAGSFSVADRVDFTLPDKAVWVRGAGINATVLNGDSSNSVMRFLGTRALIGTISTAVTLYDRTFAASTTTGLSVGDYIQLLDATSTWDFDSARNSRAGQVARITVISGSNITIEDYCWSAYSTSCSIYRLNPVSVRMSDFTVDKQSNAGDGLAFVYGLDPMLERLGVKNSGDSAMNFNTGTGGTVQNCLIEDHGDTGAGWGVYIQQWHVMQVAFNRINRGRAGLDISGEMPSRFIDVIANHTSDHTGRGLGSHATAQFCRYLWNTVRFSESIGIYHRGPDCEISNNYFSGIRFAAIQNDFGGGRFFARNNSAFQYRDDSTTQYVARGIDINVQENMDAIVIEHNDFPFETNAIRIRATSTFTPDITDLRIIEPRLRCRVNTSRTAILIGDGTNDPNSLVDPMIHVGETNVDTILDIDSGITLTRPRITGVDLATRSDAGAIPLTTEYVDIQTTVVSALTLADGYVGQSLWLWMSVDGGDATLTPTNLANGTTVTFNDVGDNAYLKFFDGNWHFMGGTATLA